MNSNKIIPCPVVFGLSGELKEAGIQTEEMYRSLEEFLDALLAAQKKTGKQVFEDDAVIDWLEAYDMPDDQVQAARLTEKLEQLRGFCGDGEEKLDAYKRLSSGECLLGGCGVYDYKNLAVNLSLFGKDQPVALFCIPDSKGSVQGIITHAAAVNAASEHVEEAVTALSMFQFREVDWAPDIPVLDADIDGILEYQTASTQEADSVKAIYDENDGIQREAARDFLNCTRKTIGSMSYVQRFADRFTDVQNTDGKKKVVSINYGKRAGNMDYPIAGWMESARKIYEQGHDDVYIQFLCGAGFDYRTHPYGIDPDASILRGSLSEDLAGILWDFSALWQESGSELDFLPDVISSGVEYDKKIIGLPICAEEFGIWCNRSLLEQAGLSEEWRPADAQEMTDGLRRLKQLLGPEAVPAVMNHDYETYQAMSLFLSEAQEDLLVQQEDGSWRCSKEGWVSYLSCLNNWSCKKLAASDGSDKENQVALSLAGGEFGVWIGGSSLSGWFDGSFGLQLTKEQQENIFFLPLSPVIKVEMLSVSDYSEHADEVFDFWKDAIQNPDYVQAVREYSMIPITELSETVHQMLPARIGEPIDFLRDEVWDTSLSAEELAEKYPWYGMDRGVICQDQTNKSLTLCVDRFDNDRVDMAI